jgi:Cys-rich protein (TIGR01571 family)
MDQQQEQQGDPNVAAARAVLHLSKGEPKDTMLSGLCGCFGDFASCLCACCVPCCSTCNTAKIVGENEILCCCFGTMPCCGAMLRQKVIKSVGVPVEQQESFCKSFCLRFFCGCCAIAQEARAAKGWEQLLAISMLGGNAGLAANG